MTDNLALKRKNAERKNMWVFVIKVVFCILFTYSFVGLNHFYFEYPKVREIVYALNFVLTGSILVSIGRWLIVSWYTKRNRKNDKVRGSFVLGVGQIAGIANVIFIVIAVMLALGIDPKEFLTSITIVAMAIALLFRDYITNMISGLLIMFSDRFTIGDIIRIGDHQGKIMDITLVNIEVKNEDDDIALIPNNTAFTSNIINQSLHNSRKITVDFQLPLAHSHNKFRLENRLRTLLNEWKEDIVDGSFEIRVVGVDEESVHYKVQLFAKSQGNTAKKRIRNAVLLEVIEHDAEEARHLKSF